MATHTAYRDGPHTVDATPTGIAIAAGAVGLIIAGLIAAAVPAGQHGWRFAIIALLAVSDLFVLPRNAVSNTSEEEKHDA